MRRPLLAASLVVLAPLSGCGSQASTGHHQAGTAQVRGVAPAAVTRAEALYAAYVGQEARALLQQTTAFARAYAAGQDDRARQLYPVARTHWERIEPVAEAFGSLDPRLDLREADLEPGQAWTGWHRAEKDLWAHGPIAPAGRARVATALVADTRELQRRVVASRFDALLMAGGAKELLDEVASGKVTGEEEAFSHTDLADFQANVDGSRAAFEALAPLLQVKDPGLVREVRPRFTSLQRLLDGYRTAHGFVSYQRVTEPRRKQLSDAVNALAEPVAQMAGVLTR